MYYKQRGDKKKSKTQKRIYLLKYQISPHIFKDKLVIESIMSHIY